MRPVTVWAVVVGWNSLTPFVKPGSVAIWTEYAAICPPPLSDGAVQVSATEVAVPGAVGTVRPVGADGGASTIPLAVVDGSEL